MRLFSKLLSTFMLSGLLVFFADGYSKAAQSDIKPVKRRIEVAFVLDTTGSMSGLIEGAKKKIWAITNNILDKNEGAEIYLGLVGYRDIGDEYVTKHFPLTTDTQTIYTHLLAFKADGGGDTPESVNEALDVGVTKLGWTDPGKVKAERILFLVGDCPPHMDYTQDRKYPEVIKEAVERGIIVNTVQAGDYQDTTAVWKKMASLGKGEYLAIPQDGGRVRVIETPYDKEIQSLQTELNKTVIPYGSRSQKEAVRAKQTLNESAAPSEAADMAKYVSKSSRGGAAVTGGGDLINDIDNNRAKLSDLKKDELPENMRDMSEKEQKEFVEQNREKRAELSKKLSEKVLERDVYIKKKEAEAPKEAADSFDRAVSDVLGRQIK